MIEEGRWVSQFSVSRLGFLNGPGPIFEGFSRVYAMVVPGDTGWFKVPPNNWASILVSPE